MKELHNTVFTPSSPVDIDEDDLQVGSHPFESIIEPIDEDDELDDDIDSWEEDDLWDDELDDDREGFEDEEDDDWDSDEDWDLESEPDPDPIESAELIPASWKSYNQNQ